jgi:hypothetical protein
MSYGMRKMRDHGGYGVVICDTQTEQSLYMRNQAIRDTTIRDTIPLVFNLSSNEFATIYM